MLGFALRKSLWCGFLKLLQRAEKVELCYTRPCTKLNLDHGQASILRLMHRHNCSFISKWLNNWGRNEKWSSAERGPGARAERTVLPSGWCRGGWRTRAKTVVSVVANPLLGNSRATIWWTHLALLGFRRTQLLAMVLFSLDTVRFIRRLTEENIKRTAGDTSLISR